MLRPANSLLTSSRATQRANINAERLKIFGHIARALKSLVNDVAGTAVDLVLLCTLPLAYLVSSYLVLDLPARWVAHRQSATSTAALLFLAALAISVISLVRFAKGAEPIAPVRPSFAKTMLALSWLLALLCTVGDVVS